MQKLFSAFEKQQCWRIEPLAVELGYSVPSVQGRLQRWKVARSHIYIAQDADIAVIQRKAAHLPEFQLSAEIAVLVLVEFINNIGSSCVQLAQALSKSKKVTVSVDQIEALFIRVIAHSLATPRIREAMNQAFCHYAIKRTGS